MDIFEFELRYLSYQGLSTTFHLWWTQEQILSYVSKHEEKGQLTKKLVDTDVNELRDLTRDTYTDTKKQLIQKGKDHIITFNFQLSTYIERIEYELKVVHEMEYNSYFLVVQDYINRSRLHDVMVWPGRWSCAGSLVCYLIKITDIDPIAFDLLFERFLNPARISMPDIDTDFEDTTRDKVIDYIREKYGYDKVAHIGTYMTMAAKAAFKDVARIFGISFLQSNEIAALITEGTIQKSLDGNEEFKKLVDSDEKVSKIVHIAISLEGAVRGTGVHACGMIIAPEPAVNFVSLQHPPLTWWKTERDETRIVSQYEWYGVEDVGLLKMDLLGLRNLTIIKQTIRIIAKKSEAEHKTLDPMFQEFLDTLLFHPPLDDLLTYQKIFSTGDTWWVFQFESDGMKNWLKKLQPNVFDDLIAMVALYRPWPMEFIPHYIDRKFGVQAVIYGDAELFEILKQKYWEDDLLEEKRKLLEDLWPFMAITYGVAVYQEQLMRLVQAMAGFSMAEADVLRRWVGKKIRDIVEKIKIEFVEKAGQYKGYKPETANRIYEKMVEPAADYSFNKSHAACYAYISYQTAYLKAHYPIEFHAALLRSVEQDTDKLAQFIWELNLSGFQVLLPSANESFEHVAALGETIRLGFACIKGIGSEIAQFLQTEREKNGKFINLEDFLKRGQIYINKRSLEALVKSWSLDEFENRLLLNENIQTMLDWLKAIEKSKAQGWGLFDFTPEVNLNALVLKPSTISWDAYTNSLALEHEIFKTFVQGHPLDSIYRFATGKYSLIQNINSEAYQGDFRIFGLLTTVKRSMKKGFFVTVEDISGSMEFFMMDPLDLADGNIVSIIWRKAKHPRILEIYVHDRADLIKKLKASGSYQENDNITKVRKERASERLAINSEKQSYTILDGIETSVSKLEEEEINDTLS